jgi:hypothetical protein
MENEAGKELLISIVSCKDRAQEAMKFCVD